MVLARKIPREEATGTWDSNIQQSQVMLLLRKCENGLLLHKLQVTMQRFQTVLIEKTISGIHSECND